MLAQPLAQLIQEVPRTMLSRIYAGLGFMNTEATLQAADILAYEINKHVVNY